MHLKTGTFRLVTRAPRSFQTHTPRESEKKYFCSFSIHFIIMPANHIVQLFYADMCKKTTTHKWLSSLVKSSRTMRCCLVCQLICLLKQLLLLTMLKCVLKIETQRPKHKHINYIIIHREDTNTRQTEYSSNSANE